MPTGIGTGISGVFDNKIGVVAPSWDNKYSIDFDGVDEFLDLGNDSTLRPAVAGGVTFSCWAKWEDVTSGVSRIFSNNSMIDYYYGIAVNKNASGWITMDTGDGEGRGAGDRRTCRTDNNELSDNTWHHIVCVWVDEDMASWKIYIDGTAVSTNTNGSGDANAYTPGNNAYIGKRFTSAAGYMDGKLDEIGFWDTALAAAEVAALYNSGTPFDITSDYEAYISSGDLIGYWRNGDPNGTASYPTITDDSTNSNNGAMTNMESGDITTDVP